MTFLIQECGSIYPGSSLRPSAKVYTLAEWEGSKRNNSPIYQRVVSEGISVV